MSSDLSKSSLVEAVFDTHPHPQLVINKNGQILAANSASEFFFQMGRQFICGLKVDDFIPSDSPLHLTIKQVQEKQPFIAKRKFPLSIIKRSQRKIVDIYVCRIDEIECNILLVIQPQTMAEKMDQHFHQRGVTRSMMNMASILAHEVKNPLFGIHGAAQLLEANASSEDKELLYLIKNEAERIKKLVERMEIFNKDTMLNFAPVNIYTVLDRVIKSAKTGFAKHVTIKENYDPSLRMLIGDQDQLIQVFMNLVKNAAEAIAAHRLDGEIEIRTAYRPGIKLSIPTSKQLTALPLEITVSDNGGGISAQIQEDLFSPFLTTKQDGSGLGLALAAKIIEDHGGFIECNSQEGRTSFSVLLPMEAAK